MRVKPWVTACVAVASLGLLAAPAHSAEERTRAEKLQARLERLKERFGKVPVRTRERFSNALANLQARSESGVRMGSRGLGPRGGTARTLPGGGPVMGDAVRGGAPGILPDPGYPNALLGANRVSNPGHDGILSRLGGFTQSETSAAWCSPNVVIGWNDSGSYLESYYFGSGGFSFNGYGVSTNNGTSYRDMGYLNVSNPDYFLEGDPVVDCSDQNTFYQASLLGDYDIGRTTIGVSKSTDGGQTFADPVVTAAKSNSNHFLDKEWMAVDPNNPNNVYVSYTDFDSSGSICGSTSSSSSTFPIFRQAIEFTWSHDGGQTWSTPVELSDNSTACSPNGNSGSFIDIGPGGEVYVAWLHFPADNPNNEIVIRKSTDAGLTFSPAVEVTQVMPMGAFDGVRNVLQGKVRFNQFPHMAVDRSTGPRSGTIYITWADGRYLSRLEEAVPAPYEDFYHMGDVFVAKSTDGGATWQQTSVKVNNNIEPPATDQFFPGITVDRNGVTTVCFYDNRLDATNFLWGRTCATSTNGGTTWANLNKGGANRYPGLRNQDVFINTRYQGDYDGLASDNRNLLGGFRGGYADHMLGNQDVKQNR